MADRFRPAELLRVLEAHKVDYVLIGGLAGTLHGSPHLTQDVDITPESSPHNLDRLSAALTAMDAEARAPGVDEPSAFALDAQSLAAVGVWNLTTTYGDLDVSFVPSGTSGYADLRRSAIELSIGEVRVVVAALADVVRSKEAASRPKDALALPTLRELLARRLDAAPGEEPGASG